MITLAPVFTDHLVFQQRKCIRVFGHSDELVQGELAGHTASSMPSGDGSFLLSFPAMEAGGPYTLTLSSGTQTLVLTDVLIGEVLLAAGQSNMELKLSQTDYVLKEDPEDPWCRFLHIPQPSGAHPLDSRWVSLTQDNAPHWSAIAFHTARMLRKQKNIPVGVIGLYQGAAVIQAFLSPEGNHDFPLPALHHPDHDNPVYHWNKPSQLYHQMIKPILPFVLSSILWYQGESNTSVAESVCYEDMLCTLIREWRSGFGSDDPSDILPAVIIQINDFPTAFQEEGWKKVQDAQLRAAAALPRTACVCIRDLGQHDLIHPVNKDQVSARVFDALSALL